MYDTPNTILTVSLTYELANDGSKCWIYACTKVNPMNSCLLFFILCFHFTHSIILIHFYEFPFFLYFSLFYFPLFAHLFATRHFTFASASRLRACPDISVGADYSAGICFRMPRLVCIRDSHAFASVRRGIIQYFPARRGRSWNEGRLWSHREIMARG